MWSYTNASAMTVLAVRFSVVALETVEDGCRATLRTRWRLRDRVETSIVTLLLSLSSRWAGVAWFTRIEEAGSGMDESVGALRELLTLDELTNRVGMSVRNVRFYTTKGLVPPPIRRGRSGYYTPDHVARLELVQELQSHGFTLSAIEKYVANIPRDATPEDIALQRAMLAPWQHENPIEMTRAELDKRAGRPLTDEDLATLTALGVVFKGRRSRYQVAVSQLSVGLGLLDLGFPLEAALAAADVYAAHGREIAEELYDVFRTKAWPVYKESGTSPERIREVVERLKPLSIASLVQAYESAMDETKRAGIAERAR
jgi:DNA-binding transcriptional MerR regulator